MIHNSMKTILGILLFIVPQNQLIAADVFAASIPALRHDAFSHVTGMTEAEFKRNIAGNSARILHRNANGQFWVKNVITNREWFAGKFEAATIQELRYAINAQPRPAARGRKRRRVENMGTFNVVVGFNPTDLSEAQQKRSHLRALQANPAHRRAVFQVASNFHGLEGAGPDIKGAGASRHLDFTGTTPRDLAQAAAFDYTQVQVGIQFETDVTFGLVKAGARGATRHHTTCKHYGLQDDRNPNIIQIYTSAVNLDLNDRRHFTPAAYADIETISQKMIKASYEGTLLAAALHGEQPEADNKQQEVFLTLMGCGAFNNKLEWVADALEELIGDIQELNLKVTLLVFDGSGAGMDAFLPRMEALVDQTGGNYEELHPAPEEPCPAAAEEESRCVIM